MSRVELNGKTILITGVAGFIGSNLAKRLYNDTEDVTVIGIDNMNDYYDVQLKEARLKELSAYPSFVFIKGNIADKALVFCPNDFYIYSRKSKLLLDLYIKRNALIIKGLIIIKVNETKH